MEASALQGGPHLPNELFDRRKLDWIIKNLKKVPFARVGILGNKTNRKKVWYEGKIRTIKSLQKKGVDVKEQPTNAMIGMVHEFGSVSKKIPQRSFLQMPIREYLSGFLKGTPELKKEFLDIIDSRGLRRFMKRIGVVGEEVVQAAFESGGFGNWPAPKHRDGMPLIDTGELRKAITSDVVDK